MTHTGSLSGRSPEMSSERTPRASDFRNASSLSAIPLKRALALSEQAAFLWTSRSAVVRSSAVTFDMLARLDERLSRLVYKLSERPVLARRLLEHDLPTFKSGMVFVTAVVALRAGTTNVFDELLLRLQSDAGLLAPLASAVSWLDYDVVHGDVDRLLAAPSPALLQLGLVAAVAHRVDPGGALDRALDAEVCPVRVSALRAVGLLALPNLRPRLQAALEDNDDTCRFWAAWSAVRLGDRAAIPILGRFAAEGGAFARPACEIALRALDTDQAVRAHQRLLSITRSEHLPVVVAGIIGEPRLASSLFDAMESPSLARQAGAAFCLMTGRDLRRNDLDAEKPLPAVAKEVPSETFTKESDGRELLLALDDSLAYESDEDLAWPDAAKLRTWWDENRHEFVPGFRYLAGRAIGSAELVKVLREGNQQQRAAAALELAIIHPETPLMDVTAPAHHQKWTYE